MILVPTPLERIARARTDLRLGLPIVLCDGPRSAVVLAADSVASDRLQAVLSLGTGTLAVTARRAQTLNAHAYDGDLARITLPKDVDAPWIAEMVDPARDLNRPLKGPFTSLRDGPANFHRAAVLLAKAAWLLPAAVVVELPETKLEGLTHLELRGLEHALSAPVKHEKIVSGRVPLALAEAGRVHVFRPGNGGEDHVAVEIGQPSRQAPVLARLHSACFTGDVLGSLKCDCGAQLQSALHQMGDAGSGVLLYLNQEGRSIGLANKMRAYSLQDQGFDTVEANHRLGFEDDERDFRTGADILKQLGFTSVRLLTNNPAKVEMFKEHGVEVAERVPLKVGRTPENSGYLDVKAKKSGHLL